LSISAADFISNNASLVQKLRQPVRPFYELPLWTYGPKTDGQTDGWTAQYTTHHAKTPWNAQHSFHRLICHVTEIKWTICTENNL